MTKRLGLWLALGIGAFAAPAFAADGKAQLKLCLVKSSNAEEDRACKDLVYLDCEAASDSLATSVLASCLARETDAWDAHLNSEWSKVRAEAEARDAADAGAQGANVKSLLAAQRAWLAYRDAECDNTYQRYIGGTIRSLMAGSCLAEMNAERVIDFRDWQREY